MSYWKKFHEDYRFQKYCTKNIIIPKWYNKIWEGAKIEYISRKDKVMRIIDNIGCTDLIVRTNSNMFGINQRVYRSKTFVWRNLGIRVERCYIKSGRRSHNTEFWKILKAIKQGNWYPKYTSHIFMNGDAICDTSDIMFGLLLLTDKFYLWLENNFEKFEFYKTPERDGKFEVFMEVPIEKVPQHFILAKYPQKIKSVWWF